MTAGGQEREKSALTEFRGSGEDDRRDPMRSVVAESPQGFISNTYQEREI